MTPPGMSYQVRPAGARDLPALLGVLAENKATPPAEPTDPDDGVTERRRATWQRMLGTADLTVYLAEAGGQAVGTATLLVAPHLTYGCRPFALLEAVVVKYAHRRRGVARLLLRRALQDARAASCLKVQLLSHKRHSEDGAHELYRSLGFTAEAEGFRLYLSP